ncbi:ubiquinone biosynthesis protein COQ4 [Synechococcus sp. CS-1332]|uniref:ubiquinone biosynthesis protein COQ4 n=1 Tax=Synechococcus sp. CS-1332 TaxID=2847972 RepID=UPI00223AFCFE|nr:ubiquinone biosynthesis protein COQ4 [Synechococcus sp. CS-1332]MCT0207297.1 ubiquinone biosynthesis protein COQ4 [Synechococcus sp. CS-1332]
MGPLLSLQPPPERREAIGRAGLGSLLAIAAEGGPPSPIALRTITAIRDHLIRLPIPLESLTPVTPEELAAAVPESEWRQRILRGMTVLALLEDEPGEARLARLEATARALHIDDAPVRAFRHVLDHQFNLVRLDIVRRGFQRGAAAAYLRDEGPAGALQMARALLKREDPALAHRYRALAALPEGSLGRAYLAFIDSNGFSVPGEVGGPPPPVVRHDCCHVLGGYGTTASEECGVLGFQAGFGRNDPFFTILFALAQFQLGIGSTPVTVAETGQADPEVIFRGLEHGLGVSRDLISDWDPWEDFPQPLEEVRRKYGIRPRQTVGADPAP